MPQPQAKPAPQAQGDAPGTIGAKKGLPAFWAPACELMERDGVSLAEVLNFAVLQGHFTPDTPPEAYPPDYIAGLIVPQWETVKAKVAEYRGGEDIPF
nr:MAG TPA: hypothetical protein [Caudoviricetes sp.]